MTKLSEIRQRNASAIPRMMNPNEPPDSMYNAYLRAEMDRNWLLYKIDELLDDDQREIMADAWDEGYAYWYDHDIPPGHNDYGKGNPYRD